MLSTRKNIIVTVLLTFFFGFSSINAPNVELVIKGIRSSKGQIVIGIFKNQESFKKDDPYIRKKVKKTKVSNGEMTVKLNLSPGTYGLALLDDENYDDKMNYSMVGIPKEGFGFSNYYHSGLTRPKFDVFKFELDKNQNKKVICRMKYM